jgi:cold shock CspA family protein
MGRSQETFNKKEVRTRKEKKRKEKEQKRAKKKSEGKKNNFDDMIAYVDEFGMISSTPPDPDKKKIVVDADSIELKITKNNPQNAPDFIRKGIVTAYNNSKGYGFIRDLSSNQSIFFHANNLLEPVGENDIVVFEIGKGAKGPAAMKVKIFSEPPAPIKE